MPNDPKEFLKQAIRRGWLSPPDASRARRRVEESGRSVEEVLLEDGALTPEQVREIARSLEAPGAPIESSRTVASVSATPIGHLLARRPGDESGGAPARSGTTKYVPREVLGRGGMGEVRLALDRDIGREVALKRLHEGSDLDVVRRFVVEAQITGQLEHPHIVPVYDLGCIDGEDRPFLAMKRIRGRSLEEVLEDVAGGSGRPGPDLHGLLTTFLKVCDAIAFAHSRGVIHRDLKPANVMVGDFGEVYVVDWGLAKVATSAGEEQRPSVRVRGLPGPDDPTRTREGQVSGTPAYMAPEQARGEIDRIDERSDVYGLGAILYQILALERPFEAGDLLDLLRRVEKGHRKPPSERSRAPWPVPPELEAVVETAMAREPDDRYPSVLDLADDVRAYVAGRALRAVDYAPWQLLWKWCVRHRAGVIAAAISAVAIASGLLLAIEARLRARDEEVRSLRASRAAAAEETYREAFVREAGPLEPFDPAAPQGYFLDRLPIATRLGRALEAHPEPPGEWRNHLARYTDEIQVRAEEVGEWALAEHLAQLAGEWGAISADESAARRERSRSVRRSRVEEDLARLDRILQQVGAASQGSLLPGEIPERARQATLLESRREVARRLADVLEEDDELRRTAQTPVLGLSQRLLAVRALGGFGTVHADAGGRSIPEFIARSLRDARARDLSPDEIALWIRSAGLVEAVRPGAFGTPGLEGLLREVTAEMKADDAAAVAARSVRRLLAAIAGEGSVPGSDAALRSDLGLWAAAVATKGPEYTGRLLDLAMAPREDLREEQSAFVLDQIGLRGDRHPPDPTRPERTAGSVLRATLEDIPESCLAARSGEALDALGRWHVTRSSASATSLARLGDPEGARVVGRLWLETGENHPLGEAIRLAVRILVVGAETPATVQDLLRRGLVRLEQGDLEGSTLDLEQAARLAPEEAETHFHLGTILCMRGEYPRALASLRRAIALRPGLAGARNDAATCLSRMGRPDEALEEYAAALAIAPDHVSLYYNRAIALREMGRLDEALADLDRAIRRADRYEAARVARAEILLARNDPDGAMRDLEAVLSFNPRSVDALLNRAAVRAARGDPAGAIADLDRVVELDPLDGRAYRERGMCRLQVDDVDGAYEDFTSSIRRAPDADSYVQRAGISIRWHRTQEARRDLDRAIELSPAGCPGALLLRASLFDRLGEREAADADLAAAFRLEPDSGHAFRIRASILFDRGDIPPATADARRSLELAADNPLSWVMLGKCLAAAGDREGAGTAFAEAIHRAPEHDRGWIERVRAESLR